MGGEGGSRVPRKRETDEVDLTITGHFVLFVRCDLIRPPGTFPSQGKAF